MHTQESSDKEKHILTKGNMQCVIGKVKNKCKLWVLKTQNKIFETTSLVYVDSQFQINFHFFKELFTYIYFHPNGTDGNWVMRL